MPRKCRRTAAVLPNIQSNCGGVMMIIQDAELYKEYLIDLEDEEENV